MEINKNKAKHTTASAVVKKCLSMVLALCMVLAMVPAGTITAFAAGDDSTTGSSIWDGTTAAYFAGGTGTAADPYQIATAEQLALMAYVINNDKARTVIKGGSSVDYATLNAAHYELTADINLNNTTGWKNWNLSNGQNYRTEFNRWWPIGVGNASDFAGTFDGCRHTVSGIYMFFTDSTHAGLFGNSSGTIENVKVADSYIYGKGYIGGVVGYNEGSVTSCQNSGTVLGDLAVTGGVVGYNNGGSVSHCQNSGIAGYITNQSEDSGDVGGVVGHSTGSVNYCQNSGAVSSNYSNTGGVVASNATGGSVSYCQNSGAVSNMRPNTTQSAVGGVVGSNVSSVTSCQNSGVLSAVGYIGGVVGSNQSGSVSSCQNSGALSGTSYIGGVVGYNLASVSNCFSPEGLVWIAPGDIGELRKPLPSRYYIGHIIGYNVGTSTGNSSSGFGTDISIDPTTATVTKGDTKAFALNGTGSNNVKWSVTGGVAGTALSNRSTTGVTLNVDASEPAATLCVTAIVYDSANMMVGATSATVTVVVPPSISTATLPNGTAGTAYWETFEATGTTPITWSVSSGSLPAGLSLNASTGAITGTPTASGTFIFTVKATNSAGSDTKDMSLIVTSTIASVMVTPNTVTVKKTNTQQFTAYVRGNGATTVTWAVTDGTSSRITQDGLLSVGGDETASNLIVTATSTVDSTKYGTATVTVSTPTTYTASFIGGTDAVGIPPTQAATAEKDTFALPANDFTKAGYTFAGWNDGTTTYQVGVTYKMPANDVSFTAQWTANASNPANPVNPITPVTPVTPVTPTTPTSTTYAASFSGGTYATGTAPTQAATVAGGTFSLPDNTFTKAGYTFASWNDGTTTYQAGATYKMPANAVTFTAQWTAITYNVTGNVVQVTSDKPVSVSGATVKLMQGLTQIGSTATTDTDGAFAISNAPNGTYNLVVSKDGITVTSFVVVNGADNAVGTITLPAGKQNSIVDVKPNTPDVIVGNLDKQFDRLVTDITKGVTATEKAVVANGGSVEIKFTAQTMAESVASHASDIKIAAQSSGETVGTYLNLSVLKTVTPSGGVATVTTLVELPSLIEIQIPLDTALQGKTGYVIYRYHGTTVDTITTVKNADGEYIVISDDNKTISLFVKKFSTYAIAYKTATDSDSGNGTSGTGGTGTGGTGTDIIGTDTTGAGSSSDSSTSGTKNPLTGDSSPSALPLLATLGLTMLILGTLLKGKKSKKNGSAC